MNRDITEQYIKEVFEEINPAQAHMKNRVLLGLGDKKKRLRVPNGRAALAVCICLLLMVSAGAFIPGVSTFAGEVLKGFKTVIIGANDKMQQESHYAVLKNTRKSRTEAKYSNLDEIEKLLGVQLLQSPLFYQGPDGQFIYHPAVRDGRLFSATVMGLYAAGDVKNLRVENDVHDLSLVPELYFTKGERYQSILHCEITIRGDRPKGVEGTEYEWNDFTMPDVEILRHPLKNVKAEAAVYEIQTDWGPRFDSVDYSSMGNEPMTVAHLTYEGVTYYYMARVSVDTMTEFLDSLCID